MMENNLQEHGRETVCMSVWDVCVWDVCVCMRVRVCVCWMLLSNQNFELN